MKDLFKRFCRQNNQAVAATQSYSNILWSSRCGPWFSSPTRYWVCFLLERQVSQPPPFMCWLLTFPVRFGSGHLVEIKFTRFLDIHHSSTVFQYYQTGTSFLEVRIDRYGFGKVRPMVLITGI